MHIANNQLFLYYFTDLCACSQGAKNALKTYWKRRERERVGRKSTWFNKLACLLRSMTVWGSLCNSRREREKEWARQFDKRERAREITELFSSISAIFIYFAVHNKILFINICTLIDITLAECICNSMAKCTFPSAKINRYFTELKQFTTASQRSLRIYLAHDSFHFDAVFLFRTAISIYKPKMPHSYCSPPLKSSKNTATSTTVQINGMKRKQCLHSRHFILNWTQRERWKIVDIEFLRILR